MAEGENTKKSLKIGAQLKGKHGSFIVLGNNKNKDPKYDTTVQIRVLRGSPKTKEEFASAEVLYSATNPLISLRDPHEKAPAVVEKELKVTLPEA